MSKRLEGNNEVSIPISTLIMKKPNTRLDNNKLLLQSVKGKEIPLQAWPGPKRSRRLRLPDFKIIGT